MLEIREIFKTIQKYYGLFMNKGDKNSVILSGAKDPLKTDTNNAILRGLNCYSPQNDRKNICRLTRGDVRKTIRKAAFTLAEVLITLGIIGVVAALTLPTLIQNHQKQVYVTQLKKAYSTINNAINKMAADEGVVDWKLLDLKNTDDCVYKNQPDRPLYSCDGSIIGTIPGSPSSECDIEATNKKWNSGLEKYKKQLKYVKIKEYGESCNEITYNNLSSFCYDDITYVFVMPDNTSYIFYCGYVNNIFVDVNGLQKGPNQYGRDVFAFYVNIDKNRIEPEGAIWASPNAWKSCSATNLSTNCTAKVLIEGKMNY